MLAKPLLSLILVFLALVPSASGRRGVRPTDLQKDIGIVVSCSDDDLQCKDTYDSLVSDLRQHTVGISFRQESAPAGSPTSSKIHFSKLPEDSVDFDIKSGFKALKKVFERTISTKSQDKKVSGGKINSIRDLNKLFALSSSHTFLVFAGNSNQIATQIAEASKANYGADFPVFNINCDSTDKDTVDACILLGLANSAEEMTIATFTSDFRLKAQSKINCGSDCSDKSVKDQIAAFFESHKPTYKGYLRMFHVTWCGHCKRALPEFKKAIDIVKEKYPGYEIEEIECESAAGRDRCAAQSIRGYPTLKYWSKASNSEEDYQAPRTADSFVKTVEQNAVKANSVADSLSQILSPGQLASYLNSASSSCTDCQLLLLTFGKNIKPSRALNLISQFQQANSLQNSRYKKAFAVIGVNQALDDYLSPLTNADASLMVLSESTIRRFANKANDEELIEAAKNVDMNAFKGSLRDTVVMFKDLEPYYFYHYAYLSKVNALTAKFTEIDRATEVIYEYNNVYYMLKGEIFDINPINFEDASYAVQQFSEFVAEVNGAKEENVEDL